MRCEGCFKTINIKVLPKEIDLSEHTFCGTCAEKIDEGIRRIKAEMFAEKDMDILIQF